MKTPSLLRLAAVAALSPLLFLSPGAGAATDDTTMNVTITITSSCSIETTTNLDFGTVASTATNVDANGTLTVTCTNQTPYNVGIDEGSHFDTTRRMQEDGGSTYYVPYALYRDASRTQAWGESIGTDTLSGTGSGAGQTITVYGRVPSANFPALSYTDTVTATLTY